MQPKPKQKPFFERWQEGKLKKVVPTKFEQQEVMNQEPVAPAPQKESGVLNMVKMGIDKGKQFSKDEVQQIAKEFGVSTDEVNKNINQALTGKYNKMQSDNKESLEQETTPKRTFDFTNPDSKETKVYWKFKEMVDNMTTEEAIQLRDFAETSDQGLFFQGEEMYEEIADALGLDTSDMEDEAKLEEFWNTLFGEVTDKDSEDIEDEEVEVDEEQVWEDELYEISNYSWQPAGAGPNTMEYITDEGIYFHLEPRGGGEWLISAMMGDKDLDSMTITQTSEADDFVGNYDSMSGLEASIKATSSDFEDEGDGSFTRYLENGMTVTLAPVGFTDAINLSLFDTDNNSINNEEVSTEDILNGNIENIIETMVADAEEIESDTGPSEQLINKLVNFSQLSEYNWEVVNEDEPVYEYLARDGSNYRYELRPMDEEELILTTYDNGVNNDGRAIKTSKISLVDDASTIATYIDEIIAEDQQLEDDEE